jgi:lactoylglutathione lyase
MFRIFSALVRIAVIPLALGACTSPPTNSKSPDSRADAETSETAPSQTPKSSVLFPAVNVLDLAGTEAFYVDLLGMKVTLRIGEDGDEHQEVTLNFSGDVYASESSLVLNYIASRKEPYVFDAYSRIAFRVPDVDGLVERIRAAGYKILNEPRIIHVEGADIKLAFVEDPNGARLELIETTPRSAP